MDSRKESVSSGSAGRKQATDSSGGIAVVKALGDLNSNLASAQRELARRNAELASAVKEKNQLLGMAAHDLRNPLGVILGVAELLNHELADSLDAPNRQLLSFISESAELMVKVIDDLLDYSKIEAGRFDLELAPVDIAGLISQNLAFNSILASKKGINLRFEEHGPPPPRLQLDSRRIQQVFNNLISNALKFSNRGSTVTVGLRCDPAEVTIEVADQGEGIAAEQIGNLFQPFSSSRPKSTGGEKSTGLGLAIVRRIVEAHGGRIRVASEPGRGSAFSVSLPIVPVATPA